MPSPVLGIDFGTTNTVVAVVQEDVSAEVLCNDIGSRLTPSVVHIDPSDPTKHQVGEAALRLGVGDPQNTIRNVKRIIGHPPDAARLVKTDLGPVKSGNSDFGESMCLILSDGTRITPEEVVAMLFLEVKKAAKHQLCQEVLKAVITVPCYFSVAQRRAIRDAAFLADLDVVELVNETTAAAAVYAHECEDSRTIVIVDVGGGGCSVSVVRVEKEEVTVLACSTRQPGGESFDTLMLQHLKKTVKDQLGKDVTDQRTDEILRAQWVGAKTKLSRLPHAIIQTYLPEIEDEFHITLTRPDFETVCADLFKQIVESIHETMKKAEVVQDAKDLILVGGSTRIPKLRELIIEAVRPNKLHKALSADEAVAQGAALLGAKSVKIKHEVLGPHTSIAVLDSKQHDNIRQDYPNSSRLPLLFQFNRRKTSNTDMEIKQGLDKETKIIVCKLPAVSVQNITIDEQGCICFGTGLRSKGTISGYLRGCIPEVYLKDLKKKIHSQEKRSLLEADRVQAKNALEDVLRKGRSMVTSEEDLFPEEHLKFRETCLEKLNWLDEHASAGIETFNEIRSMMERNKDSLQEKCRMERERLRERTALKDILDKAVDMEVLDDEFKERSRELKDNWGKEKEWLAANSEAGVEEYLIKTQCVHQAMMKLKEDREEAEIIKRTDALRESLKIKIQEIQTSAHERLDGDDLDRKWGNILAEIWKSANMWLKNSPRVSEIELKHKIQQVEEERLSTEEKFEELKKQKEIDRKRAYKDAELSALDGANLKVADFEIVCDKALMYVNTCKDQLDWLRKNEGRNATEYSKVKTKVDLEFQNLKTLHQAETNRLLIKDRFQRSLQNAVKQTEEPFSTFFKNCLVWLEGNPGAEEKLLEASLSLVVGALDELNNSKTAKGLAFEKTQSLSQRLRLQFNDSAGPAEIRREDNGYRPADYEEQLRSTLGDSNGLINHANGLPSLSDSTEQLAVKALLGAGKAGSMALLLSKVIFGGREFVSLAVRYVEESGQPVERPLFVKEPMASGEDPESVQRIFVVPFLALCKKAGDLDWKNKLFGISHAGFSLQTEVIASFLTGMRRGAHVPYLDCGAVRLDERFVQKILRQAGFSKETTMLNLLRDFFLTIDSLRRLFCMGGKWCKVLVDNCRSLNTGIDPWLTYTSAISFVSVELRRLPLALSAVAVKDPVLRLLVDAIQGKIRDGSFSIYLETCKEFFKVISGFEDDLALGNSNSIRDLKDALLKSFKYPEGSVKPQFNFKMHSDKNEADKLFQMCGDYAKPILEEWEKSWDVLLSLLTAICDVLPEDNRKETSARCMRSHGKLARDLQKFLDQFPERLTSLPAMLSGLSRARFAKEYSELHKSLMKALTAPLLPPQGPRALEQLRVSALHAISSPLSLDRPLPTETHL